MKRDCYICLPGAHLGMTEGLFEPLGGAGVAVVSADGANARLVTEHTWAMLLTLAKRLPEADHAVCVGGDGITGRPREIQGMYLGVF